MIDLMTFETSGRFVLRPTKIRSVATVNPMDSFLAAIEVRRTIPEIAADVLQQHPGITIRDIRRRTQKRVIVYARHHIWWQISFERMDISLSEIARRFDTDHATVINGIKRHASRMSHAAKTEEIGTGQARLV